MNLYRLPLQIMRDLAIARFWEKTRWSDKPHPILGTKCREWTGRRNQDGYGLTIQPKWLRDLGRLKVVEESERDRVVLVHRLSWAIAHGKIPPGKLVLHKCDNPPCVNDQHLFLGNHQDNTDDMYAKERSYWQKKRLALVISP